MIYNTVFIKFL